MKKAYVLLVNEKEKIMGIINEMSVQTKGQMCRTFSILTFNF